MTENRKIASLTPYTAQASHSSVWPWASDGAARAVEA
jgi:hypothetical protein